MLFPYINATDRSNDVEAQSLQFKNELQQRADSCNFLIFQNSKPSEYQDVRIFIGDTIASILGATITLNGYFEKNVNMFYPGQELHLRINEADEEIVTVSSYNETTLQLVLTSIPESAVVAGDKIGRIAFGGVVARVKDSNVDVRENLEYDIECVDYNKIFDKKLITDSWTNVDSRYIINAVVNLINYDVSIDTMDYDDNSAVQAEWIESGDGGNPTIDSSDYMEGNASTVLSWTFSSGTATWSATPTAQDVSEFVGVSSGDPTSGILEIWLKFSDYAKLDNTVDANNAVVRVKIGSDSSNYLALDLKINDIETDGDWHPYYLDLQKDRTGGILASPVGTPNWASMDYCSISVYQSASSSVKAQGIRILQNNSFTKKHVHSTAVITEFRSPQMKPTSLMQLLSKSWEYIWWIDYDRDIHFQPNETEIAPIALTSTSSNYSDLEIEVDVSQLGNSILIQGGLMTSESTYSQVFEGDGVLREWILKSKFSGLVATLDDNSSTDTCEGGTTTTNITATSHGLVTGDHIVNRTRSNAVRQITKVDAHNFTVEAVTGQTTGDTFSKFDTALVLGIEGIDEDASPTNYLYNSNEKSVKSATATATLQSGTFLKLEYYEKVPIQVPYQDSASVTGMKALGFGDGVFDLDPYVDNNIEDLYTALTIGRAKVQVYSNPLIFGSFKTDQQGLKAGQLISIEDNVRGINTEYVIQSVSAKRHRSGMGEFKDYFVYTIKFGTTLFGIFEFFQKLLSIQDKIEVNPDALIIKQANADEDITVNDTNATALGGFEPVVSLEDIDASDTNNIYPVTSGTWQFEPSTGQDIPTRFDLCDFG